VLTAVEIGKAIGARVIAAAGGMERLFLSEGRSISPANPSRS
jgi:RNA processing factor Prp31